MRISDEYTKDTAGSEAVDRLIQELGDICHLHYLGSTGNKVAPDGYEYSYDNEVINLLDTPEAKQAIAAYVATECQRARIAELKRLKSDLLKDADAMILNMAVRIMFNDRITALSDGRTEGGIK